MGLLQPCFIQIKGVFNIPFFNMIDLRYGHYSQTTGLQANNIGINLRFR